MDSFRRAAMLATVFLSLFLHYPSPANATLPPNVLPCKLVNDFCNKQQNKKFCVEAFKSDPQSASVPDQVTLVKVAIDMGIADITKLRNHISHVLRRRDTNPNAKPTLRYCRFTFGVSISFLKNTLVSLASGKTDKESLLESIANAGHSVQSCQHEMDSKGVHDASIYSRVNATSSVVGLAFGSMNVLVGGSSPILYVPFSNSLKVKT